MNDIKLTAKETALMTAIADRFFSFFDQGLIANDSGIWTTCMTEEVAGSHKYAVSASQRGVATVIASLGRKGLLLTQETGDDEGAWTMLTEAGQAWVEEHNGETEEEVLNAALAAREAKVETVAGQDVLAGTPEDEVEEALAEIEAEEVAAPAKKTRKALPLTSAAKMPKKAAKAAPVEKAAPAAPVHEDTETYTTNEWTEETASHGTEEWIETIFNDGSWTLRRRRNVNGAWRTDFWGKAAGAEKRVFTTSGAAKAARTAGKFTA